MKSKVERAGRSKIEIERIFFMRSACAKITLLLLVSFLAFLLPGCGDQGTPGSGAASISLSAGTAELPADGASSTAIQALVTDFGGVPVDEQTQVTFKTTLGSFPNGEKKYTIATVNDSGVAVVQLISGNATGTAEVTAEAKGVRQAVEVRFFDPNKVGHIGYITLTSSDSSLPVGSGSTSITAKVFDTTGLPMPEGTTVTFNTTKGTFPGGDDPDDTGPLASQVTLETADSSGVLITSLMAGPDPGVAEITATSGGVSQTLNIIIDDGSVVVGSITLTAGRTSMPADGSSSTGITATVTDSSGDPVPDGTPVVFSIDPADLGTFSNTSLLQSIVVSITGGSATTSLIAGMNDGVALVTATCGSKTQAVEISILKELTSGITVTAGASSLPADGASTTTIRAAVRDTNGDPASGVAVNFTTTLGSLSAASATTNASGFAEVTLQSAATTGIATVTANAGGFIGSVNVEFVSGTVEVGQINLTAAPTTLPADNTSSSAIRAEVLDSSGDPVPQGTSVHFETDRGHFSNGSTHIDLTTGNSLGIIYTSLIAGTSQGTAHITATSGDVSQAVSISIGSSSLNMIGSITLSAAPDSIPADGHSSTAITATLKDTKGSAMPAGTEVHFTTDHGRFPNGSTSITLQTSGSSGIITTSLIAGTSGGVAEVIADSGGVSQALNIIMDGGTVEVGSVSVSAAQESIPADGTSSTVITVKVSDNYGNPVAVQVSLTTSLGSFPGGLSSIALVTSASTGSVTTSLIAGNTAGVATITATAGLISQGTQVTIRSVDIPEAQYLSLSTSKTSVKTNSTDSATITALVLDASHVPIKGTTVGFSTTGGQISASSVVTDENGEAPITFTSGPDKANQTVTVTASVDSQTALIPITLYGTEVSIAPSTSQIYIPGGTRQITVMAVDADGAPIYGANITISNNNPSFTDFTITQGSTPVTLPVTLATDYQGKIILDLAAGSTPGAVQLKAEGLGTTATGVYNIGNLADIFQITAPASSPWSAPADGTDVDVTIHAGGMSATDTVVFTTSFGTWTGHSGNSVSQLLSVANEDITLQLSSTEAGLATVQIYNQADPAVVDYVQISFYNPASKAYDIVIDATQTNIPPSTSTSQYSLVIEANVLDQYGAPVQDAMVDFYLSNTTGSGEYLSPVAVMTNTAGIAKTTFTSGTLGTGSDPASAILVTAHVATPAAPPWKEDDISIVVTGAVANVSIGYASSISANEDNTLYLQPVSVLVADTNGNPVAGAAVSLGLMPSRFATGFWTKWNDEWTVVYDNSCDGYDVPPSGSIPPLIGTTPYLFVNEDLNNNAVLDGDEDALDAYTTGDPDLPSYFPGYLSGDEVPGLNNGMLTPGQSAAGTIPASVTTDENGVASFILTYQKEYAWWVEDQITATCMVYGTEYITKSRKWLPIMASEKSVIAQAFPESPFNVLPCGTVP